MVVVSSLAEPSSPLKQPSQLEEPPSRAEGIGQTEEPMPGSQEEEEDKEAAGGDVEEEERSSREGQEAAAMEVLVQWLKARQPVILLDSLRLSPFLLRHHGIASSAPAPGPRRQPLDQEGRGPVGAEPGTADLGPLPTRTRLAGLRQVSCGQTRQGEVTVRGFPDAERSSLV